MKYNHTPGTQHFTNLLTFGLGLCIVTVDQAGAEQDLAKTQHHFPGPELHYNLTVLQRLCAVRYDDGRLD